MCWSMATPSTILPTECHNAAFSRSSSLSVMTIDVWMMLEVEGI
jgi:hypothetical protein